MGRVSRQAARVAVVTLLLAVLAAPAALASEDGSEGGRWFDRFHRAKRFVVTIFSRIGGPPG